MALQNYRQLIVWQKAMELAEKVYRATAGYPKEELYGLASHTRKSAVSVPSNIAEGQGRKSPSEFSRFLKIAHGSLLETETQILLAGRLDYLGGQATSELLDLATEVGRLIHGLTRAIQRNSTR